MGKKGLIFVNGFTRPEGLRRQIERLTACFAARGVAVDAVDNRTIRVYLAGDGVASALPPADFAVYLDKDVHIAYMLEQTGLRLFNSASAVELCDDKMRTYIALAGRGIAMPKTVSSPLLYREEADDGVFLADLEKRIPYPMVVKEAFGSLGMQVYLARDRGELTALRQRLKYKPHLYQEYLGARPGTDARLLLVGGRLAAAMLRRSETDFRSNVELGGKAFPFSPPEAFTRMAVRAAEALGLDYCGVDILFGEGEEPVLCEVNSNAYFSACERVTGVDVAGLYADRIVKEIYG